MDFLLSILIICSVTFVQPEPLYTVEVVDFSCNATATKMFNLECELSRISRGIFAMSGIIDVKEDLNTDNTIASLNVYYSVTGTYYTLSPYRILPMTATDYINFGYKDYMMAEMKDCCTNPIIVEEKFVPPVTKRQMVCTNCFIPTENLPSYVRPGYYKAVITFKGEMNFEWMLLLQVEMD